MASKVGKRPAKKGRRKVGSKKRRAARKRAGKK